MYAELIYDNLIPVIGAVPEAKEDQDEGTLAERLSERCGRICYDSFGKGRSSVDYHKHILEVGHNSVYEHFNWTMDLNTIETLSKEEILSDLINRPGIWYEDGRLTLNRRCILDWLKFGKKSQLHLALEVTSFAFYPLSSGVDGMSFSQPLNIVSPETDEERWLSFQIQCSRGCSHELVRHGDRTAISQRSTRYVDESESDWELHPLMEGYKPSANVDQVITSCKNLYKDVVAQLDPIHGRKQARGAARGLLGNALSTELIFSASVAQWKRMIEQRDNEHADKEIRDLFHDHITPVVEDL